MSKASSSTGGLQNALVQPWGKPRRVKKDKRGTEGVPPAPKSAKKAVVRAGEPRKKARKILDQFGGIEIVASGYGHNLVDPVHPERTTLRALIGKYFGDEGWERIAISLSNASHQYHHGLKSNPDRKNTGVLRSRRHDLIECLKELNSHLCRVLELTPMMAEAAIKYVPDTSRGKGPSDELMALLLSNASTQLQQAQIDRDAEGNTLNGKESLNEEIKDLRLRLYRLFKLFEKCPIPLPSRTNPGKPERAELIEVLRAIFDKFAEGSYETADSRERDRDRQSFVRDIFQLWELGKPPRQ